ncbi:MAG: hypothetical protein M3308_09900 [Actinomycetota bacterium]|nr:hypothetical protein [Actinomycetota bacterium]
MTLRPALARPSARKSAMVEPQFDDAETGRSSDVGARVSAQHAPSRSRARRWLTPLGEVVVAITAALVMVLLSHSIEVDPLDRIGQVSGVATAALHFTVLGLLVVVAVTVAARLHSHATFSVVYSLACAAVAGLSTGLIAGGLVVALRGTTWPLFANGGDAAQLAEWARHVMAGGSPPAIYPPAPIHLIAGWAELAGTTPSNALQVLQIIGTALFGPIAYLAWRLLLPPLWALIIGLVGALPLTDLYKPYVHVVLVALLPLVIAFLQALRNSPTLSWRRLSLYGVSFGAVVGLLFLTYSGWFLWSALGVIAATVIIFPWRTGALRGCALLGMATVTFVAVAGAQLLDVLRAAGTAEDSFFYFDTYVEPAYIAMWRNDLPGAPASWPPPGELAGVGLFSVLLVVGLGVAIALGSRHVAVITLTCCMASAWLMRFWLAAQMYETQMVQLYPRTTPQILYCLLMLSGFAAYFVARRLGSRAGTTPATADRWQPGSAVSLGVLCAVLLFSLFAGSSTADRYMPRNDDSAGLLAYVAQMVRQEDGTCPVYSRPDRCADDNGELAQWRAAQEGQPSSRS